MKNKSTAPTIVPDEELLKLNGIVREYTLPRQSLLTPAKRIRALDHVSLQLGSGESFGIVGESGSGKSTLARTVMGLEPPQSGNIFFRGADLYLQRPDQMRAIRRWLQMVFQDPYGSLNPRHSVGRSIAEPLTLMDIKNPHERRKLVDHALEEVGLDARESSKFPHEFSGGQRQRVALARSLITRPALIIADEPVTALDVSVQAQVLNLMLELRERHQLAYLFISHDLSIIRHMTESVAVMFEGRIVEQGPTAEVFRDPAHPYSKALLGAVPRTNPSHRKKPIAGLLETQDLPQKQKGAKGCAYRFRCPRVFQTCEQKFPELLPLETEAVTHRTVACHMHSSEMGESS